MNNVKSEFELYGPMKNWLHTYLNNKYKDYNIITIDTHSERLDTVLSKYNILEESAIGIDIQIDVLGIAINEKTHKLFFIEAKKTKLTLRDLGQLWSYCKLINPEEAFLFTSANLGTLNKILNTFKREDLLDFGSNNFIKKMKVAKWDITANRPDFQSIIPKL